MPSTPVAIVTGGNRGLGAAISTSLLEDGYKVCVANVQEEKGRTFVEKLAKTYGSEKVIFSRCDVAKESDFQRTFDLTVNTFNRVDLLVNNAGIIMEHDPRKVLDVNVMGQIIGCQLAVKYMGKSGGGQGGVVVNMASLAGFLPVEALPIYTATKHAIIGLTRSYGMPHYLAKEGVIFMALCPFYANSDMLDDVHRNFSRAGLNFSKIPNILSTDFVAEGLKKLLEDKINGSTLSVTKKRGYQYIGYQEELGYKPRVVNKSILFNLEP